MLMLVCTANRTRSAYLAGYLKNYITKYLPASLRRIKVISAGTKAIRGGRANVVVALIARKNGFSLRNHTTSPLTRRKIKRANLILVMEQEHKNDLLEQWPEAEGKVFRLMEYGWKGDVGTESLNIPDPTGRNADDFRAFIATAHIEADRLLHELLYPKAGPL